MATKKKTVKIRDMNPKKQVKGGRVGDPCDGGEVTRRTK
jgi:hypothetical protein